MYVFNLRSALAFPSLVYLKKPAVPTGQNFSQAAQTERRKNESNSAAWSVRIVIGLPLSFVEVYNNPNTMRKRILYLHVSHRFGAWSVSVCSAAEFCGMNRRKTYLEVGNLALLRIMVTWQCASTGG